MNEDTFSEDFDEEYHNELYSDEPQVLQESYRKQGNRTAAAYTSGASEDLSLAYSAATESPKEVDDRVHNVITSEMTEDVVYAATDESTPENVFAATDLVQTIPNQVTEMTPQERNAYLAMDGLQPTFTKDQLATMSGVNDAFATLATSIAMNTDNTEVLVSAAEVVLPAYYPLQVKGIVETITKEDASYFSGTAEEQLLNWMEAATPQERLDGLNRYAAIAKDENAIINLAILSSMISGQHSSSGMTVFSNAMDALDYLWGGSVLYRGLKQGASLTKSKVDKMKSTADVRHARAIINDSVKGSEAGNVITEVNPADGNTVKKAIFESEEASPESVASTGISPRSVHNDAMPIRPTVDDSIPKASPALRDTLMSPEMAEDVLRMDVTGVYTPAERAAAQKRVINLTMDETRLHSAVIIPSEADKVRLTLGEAKTQIAVDGQPLRNSQEGFTIRATYGADATRGFKTTEAANVKVFDMGLPEDRVSFVHREPGTGKEYEIISGPNRGDVVIKGDKGSQVVSDPDVYIKLDWDYKYNYDDLTGEGVGMVRGFGKVSRYAVTAANKLLPMMRDISQRAVDLKKAKEVQLETLMPKVKLNFHEGEILQDIMENGAEFGRNFDRETIIAQWPEVTEKTLEAYFGMRRVFDATYELQNITHRKQLVAEGMKTVVDTSTGTPVAIAKYVDDGEDLNALYSELHHASGGWFIDPISNVPRNIADVEELDKLFDMGYRIARVKDKGGYRPRDKSGAFLTDSSYTHMILSPHTTSMTDLPSHVVRYTPGYYPRFYKETHFIDIRVRAPLNGNPNHWKTITVGAAGSRADAEKLAKQYLNKDDISSVDIRFDKNAPIQELDLDYTIGQGKMFVGHRGEHLLGTHSGVAKIEDPMTAMYKAIYSTAHKVSHDDFMATTRERFKIKYGQYLSDPDDMFSSWKHDFPGAAAAEEFRAWMRMMGSVSDPFDTYVHQKFIQLGELFEKGGKIGAVAAKGAYGMRNIAPASNLKSATFNILLGLNPVRQLFMQMSQFTVLSAANPVYAGRAMKFAPLLIGGYLAKTEKELARMSKLASKLGYSEKEYRESVKQFGRSGIPQSLDANMFQTEHINQATRSITKSRGAHAMQQAWNIAKAPVRGSTAIGFNSGELTNLTLTYAFALEKHKGTAKASGMLDSDAYLAIAQRAKSLALSPNKNGSAIWQHGAASFGTQFLAFQLKAAELVMYGKTSGLTGAERARILAGQTLLWGAEGLGIQQLYQYMRDEVGFTPSAEVDTAMRGGLIDWTVYNLINSGDEEVPSRVSVASSFSPLPRVGDFFMELLRFGAEDPKLFETIFGASASIPGRFGNAMAAVSTAFKAPDLSTDERMLEALVGVGQIAPVVSNTTLAYLGWNMGRTLSTQTYSATVHATHAELLARGILGLKSRNIDDYYATFLDAKKWNTTKKALATDIAKIVNRAVATTAGKDADQIQKGFRNASYILTGLSPEQQEEVTKLAMKNVIGQSGEGRDEMIKYLMKSISDATDPNVLNFMSSRAMNNANLSSEERQQLAEFIRANDEKMNLRAEDNEVYNALTAGDN